jgi:hypothetical protein
MINPVSNSEIRNPHSEMLECPYCHRMERKLANTMCQPCFHTIPKDLRDLYRDTPPGPGRRALWREILNHIPVQNVD